MSAISGGFTNDLSLLKMAVTPSIMRGCSFVSTIDRLVGSFTYRHVLSHLPCFAEVLFVSPFPTAIVSGFLGVLAKTADVSKSFHLAFFFVRLPISNKG